MRRLLLTALILLLSIVTIVGCTDKSENANAQASNTSTDTNNANNAIFGAWQIEFYSYDNQEYLEYSDSEEGLGIFTFKEDGTATLRYNATNINTYSYKVITEKKIISFSSIETGTNIDFYFGYSLIESDGKTRLLISSYNATDKNVMYLILKSVEY